MTETALDAKDRRICERVMEMTKPDFPYPTRAEMAQAGENVTLIKALSRHRSLRSLERYVNPSNGPIAQLTARHDPNRRYR